MSTLIAMLTHDDEGARLPGPESRVHVSVIAATSAAPHKAGEGTLYVMRNAADPDGNRLYFTEAEWEAFVKGVKDGEFDLDESGNLPQHTGAYRPLPSGLVGYLDVSSASREASDGQCDQSCISDHRCEGTAVRMLEKDPFIIKGARSSPL